MLLPSPPDVYYIVYSTVSLSISIPFSLPPHPQATNAGAMGNRLTVPLPKSPNRRTRGAENLMQKRETPAKINNALQM